MNTLPITSHKEDIINAIRKNKVVIVTGDTGCGKTSQLPVILHEMGLWQKGVIAVAQPRRAAAISIAEYVAKQIGSQLGDRVGYHVRFGKHSVSGTAIKFATDGILLRELISDPLLRRYSALVVDEAHERSIEIDLLLGLAKRAVSQRDDFRLIVASATLNTEVFASYFTNAPVIHIPGKQFPVAVTYHRRSLPEMDWMILGVAKTVMDILKETAEGDILVFMPGQHSIDAVISKIWRLGGGKIITLPFHKRIEAVEYRRVFENFPGMRKVIVATNIAETSLTLPTVKFVVDSGLIKESSYDPHTGIETLAVVPHSRSGCIQRSGRVGRVSEGSCYRMYTESEFAARHQHAQPELLRSKLDSLTLYLKSLGFDGPSDFDFIEQPDESIVRQAKDDLFKLGALSITGEMTPMGKLMAILPLPTRLSRLVIEAIRQGCVREIVCYVSFLGIPNVFSRPFDREDEARCKHSRFQGSGSDVFTYLKVWQGYTDSGCSKAWCDEHFLCFTALVEVGMIREQLSRILLDQRIAISSDSNEQVIRQTMVASLYGYLLKHQGGGWYTGVTHDFGRVRIHPESVVEKTIPDYLIAGQLLKLKQLYALQCTAATREMLSTKNEDQKTIVENKVTLVFVKRRGELCAFYQGKILTQIDPGSDVPVPGKLYSCSIYSNGRGPVAKIIQEIVPGSKSVCLKV